MILWSDQLNLKMRTALIDSNEEDEDDIIDGVNDVKTNHHDDDDCSSSSALRAAVVGAQAQDAGAARVDEDEANHQVASTHHLLRSYVF